MQIFRRLWKQNAYRRHHRFPHLFMLKIDQTSSHGRVSTRKRGKNAAKTKLNSKKYADFKKKLTVTKTKTFGRCIKAGQSMTVGMITIATRAFAAAVERMDNVLYCLTCHEIDAKFSSCSKCSKVFYCSSECEKVNLTHAYECGTEFQDIRNLDAKCAIQIVFEAMATFNKFTQLKRFVERAIKCRNKVPEACNDRITRLDCIFKLKPKEFQTKQETAEARDSAWLSYKLIVNFPQVRQYFGLDLMTDGQRFLEHFLAHNISVLSENGFRISLAGKVAQCDRILIYDVLSFLNHSCAPNLLNYVEGNKMTCITSQRIQRSEQLFITYRPLKTESKRQRQHELSYWNFICQCVRCDFGREINATEIRKAKKLSKKELERKLNELCRWTPQKEAYIEMYKHFLGI